MADGELDMQYADEFTRIVSDKFYGEVIGDEHQYRDFEQVFYGHDLAHFPLEVGYSGRTLATDIECRYVYDLVPVAMVAAIAKFCPGHVDVEPVPNMEFLSKFGSNIKLFRCKSTDGVNQLFIFELRESGYDTHSLSMIGPLNLDEIGLLVSGHGTIAHQLRDMEGVGIIQLFNELTRMRQLYMLELERRAELMYSATESLLDVDQGLGCIGADNLALVSQLLMRLSME
jgi:uncharacterized membrane protein